MMNTTSTGAVSAHLGIRFAELSDPANGFSRSIPYAGQPEFQQLAEVPIFPQLPSRLEYFMGEKNRQNPQSIDAFYLNVWAQPGWSESERSGLGASRPVLVFIHGGAWATGGGSVPWYRGEQLAKDGAVVVTINYRLGPYGHFAMANDGGPNRPMTDLLHGLQWVQNNIADYGGDPTKVTVMGQSAGAWYALALSRWEQAQGLFSQTVLLSLPSITPWSAAEYEQYSERFRAALSAKGAAASDVQAVLEAGAGVIAEIPWEKDTLPSMYLPTEDLESGETNNPNAHIKRALIRYTVDEMSVFLPDASPQEVQGATNTQFGAPARTLAKEFQAQGIDTQLTMFEWGTSFASLGAGHCVDLPFQFGNPADWNDAPMLEEVTPEKFGVVSARSREEVIEFVFKAM